MILHITITILMWLGAAITFFAAADGEYLFVPIYPFGAFMAFMATGLTIQFFTTKAWRKRVENRRG